MAQKASPAMRRYLLRFAPAMLAYVAVLPCSILLYEHFRPTGLALWAVAAAPALPIVAVIGIMGLYLAEETDEFQRNMSVQALLWAMGVTLAGATVWGFLENFGAVGHAPTYLAFPVFCGAFGLAQPLVRWRYK
jgi:xanthosine utilization system XapX-like protein